MKTGVSFNPERIPPEIKLLLDCVRHFLNPSHSIETCADLDWELVEAAALWHRVHPMMLRTLGSELPEPQRKNLWELYKNQSRQGLIMAASLNRILTGFKEQNIPVLQIKGLSLGQLAYGDLSVRTSVDLDLLILPKDANRAISYLKETFNFKPYLPINPLHERLRTRVDCEEALTDGLISLDIHWACSLFKEMFPLKLEHILNTPFLVETGQLKIPTMPLPYLLSFLCFHGAKHQWAKLFWIADVAALSERFDGLEWEQITLIAEELKQTRSLAQGILLAHHLFGVKIPKPVMEILNREPTVAALVQDTLDLLFSRDHSRRPYEIEVSLAQKMRWELRLYSSLSTRLSIFLRYIFQPSTSDIRAVALPGLLYPIYYLVRPIRLVLREILGKLGTAKK